MSDINYIRKYFSEITKYEKARIIGIRAEQIANGSPFFVKIDNIEQLNPIQIAEKEFESGKSPIRIQRNNS
jgi:DNA-directed RNA polymerase subunit K/omega